MYCSIKKPNVIFKNNNNLVKRNLILETDLLLFLNKIRKIRQKINRADHYDYYVLKNKPRIGLRVFSYRFTCCIIQYHMVFTFVFSCSQITC